MVGMPVRLIDVPTLADAPYSYAASAPAGSQVVALAGACPLDEAGRTVAIGHPAGQAERCLQNLAETLTVAGADLRDVLSTRILVATTDRSDLSAVWSVVEQAFSEHPAPSTLIGVTVLGYPDQLVEIEAIAALSP